MAISTYAQLQTAIAEWLERNSETEVTDNVADWIKLAESNLVLSLNLRALETEATLTGVVGNRAPTGFPTDFKAPISLFITTSGYGPAELTPQVAGKMAYSTTNGTPTAWVIDGTGLKFNCPCDQAYTFAFRYEPLALALATTDPNWLLTNHPGAYLAASLVEACLFFGDHENAGIWQARMDKLVGLISDNDHRSKAVAVLTADPALLRSHDTSWMLGFV
jgi:hypothetical protein